MSLSDLIADFPIFQKIPHVYLDSAATTHKPRAVIDALTRFYEEEYGTVRRGLYQLSSQATKRFEEVRQLVARWIGATSDEVIFTSGATESINLVASSYLRFLLRPGDEILISILEHHANFLPWQQLAIETQTRLVIAPLNSQGDIDLEKFYSLLSAKTKMVAITHLSNVTGGMNPVKEMITAAHQWGTRVLVDGSQMVAHHPVDVSQLDCDFYCFSAHKMYGPTGTGILFGKKELLEKMPPYRFGGEMILEVTPEFARFKKPPHRFEAGTPHIAGVIGLGAALEYLSQKPFTQIIHQENQLLNYLLSELEKVKVQIVGNPRNRSSLVSFLMDDIHPHDVATLLDQLSISVRAGHHCAQPLMRYLGIPATVRVSLGIYNSSQDVDALIDGIKYVQNKLS